MEAVQRNFEKRRLLQAYNLFVQLVCKEVRQGDLQGTRSFIVMDIVHSMVRIVNKDKPSMFVLIYTNIMYTNIMYTNIMYTNIMYTNIM